MKRCKWIARLLVATLTVNTATGYIPPAQIVQAGQNMPETNGSVNSAARAASKTAHSLWRVIQLFTINTVFCHYSIIFGIIRHLLTVVKYILLHLII